MTQIETLLIQNKSKLMARAVNLTKDKFDADDLFQQTALQLLKHQDKYKDSEIHISFLYIVMRNIFINNYRSKQKRLTDELMINKDDVRLYYKSSKNEGELKLLHDDLMNIINSIPDKMRIPFLLKCDGFHYDEISEKTNQVLGTTKSRIHHARKELQLKLR